MGKPIAYLGCYHVCPDKTSNKDHEGGVTIEAASTVFAGGMPVCCVGDQLVCRGPADTIVEGSTGVFVEGRPVARVGDATAHGGKIVIGNPTVLVGDQVSVGPGAAATSMLAGAPVVVTEGSGQSPAAPEALTQSTAAPVSGVSARSNKTGADLPARYTDAPSQQPHQLSGTGDEKPEDKKRVLRIGVFFDGTGNHKDNDRYLTDRDITNVAKLFDLYDIDQELVERIYIPGVGTIDGEHTESGFEVDEDLIGMATGIGPNGGHDRIELAVNLVRDAIEDHAADRVVFDIFGFSRGAALARHFANLVNDWPSVIFVPALRSRLWSNRPIIYRKRVDAFPSNVQPQVSFVGLFDTVGSFYIAGNEVNLDFNLYLPSACADRVVHLTAYHEIRRNFPLSSIKGPGGKAPAHFTELVMPGAHSDVGGGYENPEKDSRNYEVFDLKVYGGHGTNWRTVQIAQREIEAWNARDSRNIQPEIRGMDVYAVERRPTRKELAIYALYQMYDQASSSGVPLQQVDKTLEEYRIPMDLRMAIDDWQSAGAKLDNAQDYFGNYIHTSHRSGSIPHGPTTSGKREVYPNRPIARRDHQRMAEERLLETDEQ